MDVYLLVLRLVHIATGVFWVGTAFFVFFFLEPTVNVLGPQAGPVMSHLTQKLRLPLYVVSASALTILAGLLLYWRDSNGFDLDWVTSATGLAFGIGGLAAIVAFTLGLTMIRPAASRMGELAQEVGASGGPPSAEQAAEMQSLQHRLRAVGRIDTILLGVALVLMAVARYLD